MERNEGGFRLTKPNTQAELLNCCLGQGVAWALGGSASGHPRLAEGEHRVGIQSCQKQLIHQQQSALENWL